MRPGLTIFLARAREQELRAAATSSSSRIRAEMSAQAGIGGDRAGLASLESGSSLTAVGRWSVRHPWRAVGAWLVFVIASVAVGSAVGTKTLSNGAVGESARGDAIIAHERLQPPLHGLAYIHARAPKAVPQLGDAVDLLEIARADRLCDRCRPAVRYRPQDPTDGRHLGQRRPVAHDWYRPASRLAGVDEAARRMELVSARRTAAAVARPLSDRPFPRSGDR